jgi:hypothetical protein
MRRVVPSQVVLFIDQVLPWLLERGPGVALHRDHAAAAAALLELVDRIPDELLTIDTQEYNDFVYSVAAIRDKIPQWQNLQNPNMHTPLGALIRNIHPVALIRETLSKCHDDGPTLSTSGLRFIQDTELRTELRSDLGAIERALSNGEWKAATILAGSSVEVLLLWALQQKPRSEIPKLSSKALDDCNLADYIKAAHKLGIIKESAVSQVTLTRNFRNLIHPGKAQRLKQKCDKATALSAVAGLEHVMRDLGNMGDSPSA